MQKPLRLWPGLVAAVGLLVLFLIPAGDIGLIAGFVSTFVIVVWWLFLSRAPWLERVGAFLCMILALAVMRPLLDKSITGGAMGGLQYLLSLPVMCLALVAWAFLTRNMPNGPRRALLLVAMVLAGGSLLAVRTDGIGGGSIAQLRWRWTPTAEDRLLASEKEESLPPIAVLTETPEQPLLTKPDEQTVTAPPPIASVPTHVAEWPGFRGPERNSVVRGVRIESDWSKSPPVKLWSRPIGPGWSSFAVDGDFIYTQEQRGEEEIVSCYRLSTGQPVWRHRDPVRFWESNAGAGPRGTPTISNGRIYALGATGTLNALDARTGKVIWSRNAASDTKTAIPMWGISSSPLVIDDVVIVATGGALAGYDIADGKPRWIGKENGFSYSSPHLVTIDGVKQAVFLTGTATTSVAPADGKILWQHTWEGGAIVQPAVINDTDLLINSIGFTGGNATRRLTVKHTAEGWSAQDLWTSNGLKPYFNDLVVHKGHAYGFDGEILSSIDLTDGKRKWKGGRYGNGQLILLADQDLLLVLSDLGELVLVSATPEKFNEISRAPALEGKTWNHPVLVGDVLLIRNGEEMVAYKLALAN